jgi:hemoglobin/transferrin/lactoferrin receptor protein
LDQKYEIQMEITWEITNSAAEQHGRPQKGSMNGTIFANFRKIFPMSFRLLFATQFLLISLQLFGQQIRVISSSDGSPIEHVAVYNSTRERAALTDTLGRIDLSLFQGTDTLFFQHPSFELASRIKNEISSTVITLQRKRVEIEEYVIAASKSKEQKLVIPYMVGILEESQLRASTGMTAAEVLEGTGHIVVQKTQGGGGSPILRGFEANKILLVVDGIRLNNAIYRSGHLQNSITIDQSVLDRTEIIFGPSSVIYGSDALGGVIHYYTKDPEIYGDSLLHLGVQAYAQFASANHGLIGHLDFSSSKRKWGSLTSITYKDLGDIRMGARRSSDLGDWGKRMHYVDQVNGVDSTLVNENPLIQKNTGYKQIDLMQKVKYAPTAYSDWILNLQYSTSSDIDRLDKLNDYSGENLKYASYYYGPQQRLLISLKNSWTKENLFFDHMTTIAAYQRIDEDRHSRRFRNEELLNQQEDVTVLSLNMDLLKRWNDRHRLNYGVDFSHNLVKSQAWYENISDGQQTFAETRYPDGGSRTWNSSAYVMYKWNPGNTWVFNGGARYNWGHLFSRFEDTQLPYDRIEIRHGALTGSAGLVYTPSDLWQINVIISTGFRNPNVDDYGKVRAKDGEVTVPNKSLSPEYSYNAEIGIKRSIADMMKVELVGYYTYLRNAIVRTDYQINGEDSLYYDGEMYNIITNYNAGEAYIYGSSLGVTLNPVRDLLFTGTLNYTRGQNMSDNVPLGHIPPLFGRLSLTYRMNRFFIEAWTVYQGWKHTGDFSPFGEDNEGEAMEEGFPAWWTVNLKAGLTVGEHVNFIFALENIFDQFYKPFASGISGPGRNMILTARIIL